MQDAASTSSGGDNAASRNEKRDERASFVKSFVSLNGQTLENMEYKMVSWLCFDERGGPCLLLQWICSPAG